MKKILLILLMSISLDADFIRTNNSVHDIQTALEWQDNNETNSTKYSWQEAIDYCERLLLNEDSDWRLPNINELKTVIDRSQKEPAIKGHIFEYLGDGNYYGYWSSTSVVNFENYAWIVYFGNGATYSNYKEYNGLYVRCVRDVD